MRFGLILLCAGLLSAQPEPDKCRLEGKVLNSVTGAPVRKAQVVLDGVATASRPAAGPAGRLLSVALTAATDSEGRFVFEGLDAGTYTVMAFRDGFRNAATQGRLDEPTPLVPGEDKRDLILKVEPLTIISGRVRDEDGDPVRAEVSVMKYEYGANGRDLVAERNADTNDLGEYRVFDLPPGKHYVKVTPSPSDVTIESSEESYPPTFFPSAFDASTASAIDLGPGQERSGTDVTLRHTRTVTVSGRVVKPAGALGPRIRLEGVADWQPAGGVVVTDPHDGFQIARVSPGSYVLTADTSVGDKAYAARVPLQVAETNIEDLVVKLAPTFDVNGRIRIEGAAPAGRREQGAAPAAQAAPKPGSQIGSPLSQISAFLGGRSPPITRRTADGSIIFRLGWPRPNDDGTVVFRDLAPDIYTVHVDFPETLYLKSMRCGDREIADLKIDLTGGAGCELSVVLSYNGGRIDGGVEDENGKPVASAVLTLVPVDSIRKSVLFKTGAVSQQGSFTISSISPGAYRLYAWEDVDANAVRYDPDFLKPYEALGLPVQISEGGSEHVTVKLIRKPAEP
ncbi:MAG: carboxypeptidase regulatory-like domain-containing protein [Bryobacteraceae bacterium]